MAFSEQYHIEGETWGGKMWWEVSFKQSI